MASSYGKGKYGSRLYSLAPIVELRGNLTPSVGFSGGLDVLVAQGDLAGNLRPLVTLAASLTADRVLQGSLAPQIILAAQLTSGPLWAASVPGAPPWNPSEPCPPSLWTPVDPCDPVEWEDSELCNG
jgi:hypothetical protein